jgi:hypothetical protein
MPPEVQSAYEVWRFAARRNQSETARLCDIPRSTVQLWYERYRWREVAAEEDSAGSRDALAAARAHAIAELHLCDQVRHAALVSRIGDDGKPTPGTPTSGAIKMALGIYDRFGFSPQRHVNVEIAERSAIAGVSDAELDALIAAGDMDTLLALASGKPLPTSVPTPPLPRDFPSTQPGGREVSDPPSPRDHDQVVAPVEAAGGVAPNGNGRG